MANLTSYVKQNADNIATKQDTLVSGTNIKTINNTSILGSGNFDLPTTELTDSVSTESSTIGASATAVKTAYDKGVQALNVANSNSVTTSSVLNATAGATAGAIGTYVFAIEGDSTHLGVFGNTISGSYLTPISFTTKVITDTLSISSGPNTTTLSGTWRNMSGGASNTLYDQNNYIGLWLRIA